MSKKTMSQKDRDIYASFKTIPKAFDIGQVVKLSGTHPFAGHSGEIVRLEKIDRYGLRPVVRVYDMADHEVFIMTDSDARILK